MRTGILTYKQSSDSQPEHFVSKKLAAKFLSYCHNGKRAVMRISESLLQIQVNVTFGKLKALLRNDSSTEITILPVREDHHMLLLAYPVKDLESFA